MTPDADDGIDVDEKGTAAPGSAGSNGDGEESAAAAPQSESGEVAPVLDEILRVVRYLSGLADEAKKKRPAGPSRSAFDKLVKVVNAIGENAGETRKIVEGLTRKDSGNAGQPGAEELAQGLRACRADFGRWAERERQARRRWLAPAIAAGFPAALLLGVLIEQQFQVIPLHDPTGGWRGHVWDNYGRTIVDCAVEAMNTEAAVDCPLVVRKP